MTRSCRDRRAAITSTLLAFIFFPSLSFAQDHNDYGMPDVIVDSTQYSSLDGSLTYHVGQVLDFQANGDRTAIDYWKGTGAGGDEWIFPPDSLAALDPALSGNTSWEWYSSDAVAMFEVTPDVPDGGFQAGPEDALSDQVLLGYDPGQTSGAAPMDSFNWSDGGSLVVSSSSPASFSVASVDVPTSLNSMALYTRNLRSFARWRSRQAAHQWLRGPGFLTLCKSAGELSEDKLRGTLHVVNLSRCFRI